MSITQRLLLTILCASIPIGVLQALSVQRDLEEQKGHVAQQASGIAFSAAAEQRRIADGARQLLSAMSQLPAIREGNAKACAVIAKRLQSEFPMYTAIGIADTKGRIWCSSATPGTDISDRPYFSRTLETRKFTVGGFIIGRLFGRRTLNFSLPYTNSEGNLAGVLTAGLDLDALAADLGKAELPPQSDLVVYSPDRIAVVHLPDGSKVGTQLPANFDAAFKASAPGTMETRWFDGSKRLVAYVPPAVNPSAPFLIAIGINNTSELAKIEAGARNAMIVLVIVGIAALLFAWWFGARYVRRPLQQLADTVQAWREGDSTARIGKLNSGSEFDELAQAFEALSDTVAERQRRLRDALENTTDSVAVIAPNWEFTFLNEKAVDSLYGAEVVGKNLWDVFPEIAGRPVGDALMSAMTERRPITVTFANEGYGGHFETNAYPAEDGGLVLFSRDVTEELRSQQELRRLALSDPLTDLPNRSHAMELAQRAAAEGRLSALLILDLDSFKHVNDSLGHPAGDEMLRDVASRLSSCLGDRGIVARLGGDEFIALFLDTPRGDVETIAQELLDTLEGDPFIVRNRMFKATASCGIGLVEENTGEAVEDLLANADIALYRAKAEGGGICCTYTSADRDAYISRLRLEEEVAAAAVAEQFELRYQPQIRLDDGAVVGVEALLRWRHPTQGLQPPAMFMGVLEVSRHALTVGTWVLEDACRQASLWWQAGRKLRVGVNLFPQQLETADLPNIIQGLLQRHGIPPEALELELTENIALAARKDIMKTLFALRDLGISLAFDDFGTGFASLTTLKDLPVNRLKIDRSFVTHLPRNEHDMAIVEAVLALARTLDLEVVAEGVETQDQAEYLRSRGCPEAQGYLYGKPMTADELDRRLGDGPMG